MRNKSELRTQNTEHRLKNKKNIFHYRYSVFYALCSMLCALLLLGCTKQDKLYKESRMVMDTLCTITVASPSKEKAEEAIEAGFAEIKRLEGLLNYFSADSEITRINNAAGKRPIKVSKETLEIVKKAVDIADATNGAFDLTIAPVIKLWRVVRQSPGHSLPSRNVIENALRLVNYKKVKINNTTSEIYLEDKGMEIDLGGIAKGYAADKAIGVMKAKGVKSALVAIAGDIKGFGLRPDLKPWKVGIQNPRPAETNQQKDREDIFASLYLRDKAISTSGDYQRFFIKDGKRYHHIIDPKTGYPATSHVISVSVIASEGYMADSLSTGIFILGTTRGIALLESMGIEGVIVDSNKKIFLTKNLKGKVTIEDTF